MNFEIRIRAYNNKGYIVASQDVATDVYGLDYASDEALVAFMTSLIQRDIHPVRVTIDIAISPDADWKGDLL